MVGGIASSGRTGSSSNPLWLDTLMSEKFFIPCLLHETARKNEKNIFCLDCCTSICPHCLHPHQSHRLLQAYTTNSSKVVFLNQRPQSRPFRGSGNMCSTCDRSLQDPFLFCSLACKVEHLIRREGSLTRYLYECDYLPLHDTNFRGDSDELIDDGQMTPDSVLESPVSYRTPSFVCPESELVRKKRSNVSVSRSFRSTCSSVTEPPNINSRRKGVPQRAPLY